VEENSFKYQDKTYEVVKHIDGEPTEPLTIPPGRYVLAREIGTKLYPELKVGDVIVVCGHHSVVLDIGSRDAVDSITGVKFCYNWPIDNCMILRDGEVICKTGIWNSKQDAK
jgi:hypothetical protein